MITVSESDGDSPGSTKHPTSSQDAPSQDAPADDAESSEAKAASTSSPAKNLTLTEGKARAHAAKAASPKRAGEGAAAAKKRAAPGSPTTEPSIAKGFKSLFDSSDEEEEEGAPQEISNDLDEQQERYQAAQLQGTPVPPTPVYPRGYYPPDAGSGSPMFLEHLKAHRGLNHGRTSRGAYERALVQVEPLFVNDIKAARCVLLAPHRIPLKEFTSLRKKPEDRGLPLGTAREHHNQTQAEDLFWRWVSLTNFTVQELQELREDRLLSYVLNQRDLRIEFAHLIAKWQLHSVMEGLRQQSKSSAQDERGDRTPKAAKKPRTTYAPAVADPKSQQPSGSQPGAGLPAPVLGGTPATSLAAGASQSAAALGRPAPHGSRARRSDQGGQEELSHAFEYEAPSQPYPSGPSTSGRDSVGPLLSDEVRQLRDRVYAIEIALGLGPGGQAASQAGKTWTLEVLRQDMDALGRETHELHGRVDRRAPAAALKELRRGLDALSHEVHVLTRALPTVYRHTLRMTLLGTSLCIIHRLLHRQHRLYRGLTLVFLRPRRKTQRIVIPLKTPHVERRVNGIRRAMSGQDRKGSNEAMLQLVALYRANHL
ncbi:LOW QUALITY PROTEIN: ATP-binding cassette (ABC) Superfamily [Phytophthora palmivora]|uniref:ATP-binding cassette (ABC) Superfamily n=1 Tax=Phytophthora palmivora TaxID=4796 RepID=A0A2P4XT77_9STRA|nr:LOW QUALITY PROTEIN: ATP-binding cassette (ABC) Superfamily [Phytophthora palmivora]